MSITLDWDIGRHPSESVLLKMAGLLQQARMQQRSEEIDVHTWIMHSESAVSGNQPLHACRHGFNLIRSSFSSLRSSGRRPTNQAASRSYIECRYRSATGENVRDGMGVNLHALHVSLLVSPIQHTRFGFWLGMVVVGVEYNAWIAT